MGLPAVVIEGPAECVRVARMDDGTACVRNLGSRSIRVRPVGVPAALWTPGPDPGVLWPGNWVAWCLPA